MPKTYLASYSEKLKQFKLLVVALVIFLVVASGFSYYTYTILLAQKQIIAQQNSTILQHEKNIQENLEKIENLTATISEKNIRIQEQKNEIGSQRIVITDLSEKLGLARTELEELTPTIKSYAAVGVGGSGKGFVIPMEVKLIKGSGIISVNIKNVDLLTGTQESIRDAVECVTSETGVDISKKDITVSFINEFEDIIALDGPSAGTAITVTLLAAVQNKTLNDKFLTTGVIFPTCFVGKVGGVFEKAVAAKDYGATTFLVPEGQKVEVEGLSVVEITDISNAVDFILQ